MTSTPTRPVDNVVIATKGLQERNLNILAGTTVENKGKLILIQILCDCNYCNCEIELRTHSQSHSDDYCACTREEEM